MNLSHFLSKWQKLQVWADYLTGKCVCFNSFFGTFSLNFITPPRTSFSNPVKTASNKFCLLQVRRSMINRGSRLRDSVKSDGDSTSLLSSTTDEDCASVTLDPLEHEWMLCASDGLWDSLQPLLAVEPGLLTKRDFVTGFTCLHWAAKQGKAELLSQLLAFAKQNAIPVNVNVKSSAGYTPLHLAAMHGHTQVCWRHMFHLLNGTSVASVLLVIKVSIDWMNEKNETTLWGF